MHFLAFGGDFSETLILELFLLRRLARKRFVVNDT